MADLSRVLRPQHRRGTPLGRSLATGLLALGLALGAAGSAAAQAGPDWLSNPHERAASAAALLRSEPLIAYEDGAALLERQSGGLSAEAITRQYLERIAALNDGEAIALRAVIAVNPAAMDDARALDQARAGGQVLALHGLPVLIKDNIETRELPTTAGSLALSANAPGRDAPLAARLREGGAIILGKANLSEWANIRSAGSISGWSAVGGLVRNPHALDRSACGSSSGSAVAVAAGLAWAAIGTETDGSIVCPAAVNGIVGFKPTVGLVSRTHIIPISESQDTAGPMTRSVRDAALILGVIAGSDPSDPATIEADARREDYAALLDAGSLAGTRIGVVRFLTGYHAETDATFEAALQVLRDQGAILVEITTGPDRAAIGRAEFAVLLSELRTGLNAYLESTDPAQVPWRSLSDIIAFNRGEPRELALFGQTYFEAAERTSGPDDPDYLAALETSRRLAGEQGIDAMLSEHDVVALIAPTTGPAWAIDVIYGDRVAGSASQLAAVAGYPHLTVPMGLAEGMPVGLSFFGAKWSDALILSLGYAFEQASGARVHPALAPSVEARPEVARALRPAGAH